MKFQEAKQIIENMLYEHKTDYYSRFHFSEEEFNALETIVEILEQNNSLL